jgi:hypothetical protein
MSICRRAFERNKISEEVHAVYMGQRCRVLNLCPGGMSVVYARFDPWPDLLSLDILFPNRRRLFQGIRCQTVWEDGLYSSDLLFNNRDLLYMGVLRKRGFQFLEHEENQVRALSSIMGTESEKTGFGKIDVS